MTKPAHDCHHEPLRIAHRRSTCRPPPRHPGRARPRPRRHQPAAPGEDPGQRRHRRPPRRRVSPLLAEADDSREATWRERALNAEDALKAAHAEIVAQRNRIGELLGRIRDLEAEWTQDAVERITTENTTLKQRVRQLTTDNRTLDERLKAARSNLRFQDRRIADLEARVADPRTVS
jgi:chromosome segregation ATPase